MMARRGSGLDNTRDISDAKEWERARALGQSHRMSGKVGIRSGAVETYQTAKLVGRVWARGVGLTAVCDTAGPKKNILKI